MTANVTKLYTVNGVDIEDTVYQFDDIMKSDEMKKIKDKYSDESNYNYLIYDVTHTEYGAIIKGYGYDLEDKCAERGAEFFYSPMDDVNLVTAYRYNFRGMHAPTVLEEKIYSNRTVSKVINPSPLLIQKKDEPRLFPAIEYPVDDQLVCAAIDVLTTEVLKFFPWLSDITLYPHEDGPPCFVVHARRSKVYDKLGFYIPKHEG